MKTLNRKKERKKERKKQRKDTERTQTPQKGETTTTAQLWNRSGVEIKGWRWILFILGRRDA